MPTSGGTQFINPQDVIQMAGLTEGMKVADLGCGNIGYFIIPIAKAIGKDGIAYGIDIQKPVLEAVRGRARIEGLTNLELVWANLEIVGSTKIADSSIDAAFLVNILFQNKKRAEIIREAARILKKGGKLVVIDWKKIGIPFGPPVEDRVDPEDIKSISTKLGLKLASQTEVGDYFWGLVFEKV